MNTERTWVQLGKIVAPQGIKGEVRFLPDTDFPERLQERDVYLLFANGNRIGPRTVRLQYTRGIMLVLAIEGVHDRDEAEDLRGTIVQVPAESLPKLPEGEYYHFELIGLTVQTTDGQLLGLLHSILPTGSNDVYVVRSEQTGQEWLIPAIRDVVREIDTKQGVVTIQPMPGLLE